MIGTRKRHIAFFLRQLRDGGVPRQTLQLSAELARRGHRVSLLPAIRGGVREPEVDPSVELHPLDSGLLPSLASRGRTMKQRDLASIPALARWLARERPDALISADHWPNFAAVAATILARRPTRLMLTQRIPLSVRARRDVFIGMLARALYPRADLLVGVSRALASDLAEQLPRGHDRIRVLYNPVVTPDFSQRIRRRPDHPWLADPGPPVVMSAGRLTEQKDQETLLRAFALLRRERKVRLVVLGEGSDRGKLAALCVRLGIANDVDFTGFVPDPLPFMARASVFALTSRWEGLPAVLIEALYCGVPVVSTDCPTGPEEILEGGLYGTLVRVGDVDAVRAALADALDKPTPAARLRARARSFDLATSADGYLAALFPAETR